MCGHHKQSHHGKTTGGIIRTNRGDLSEGFPGGNCLPACYQSAYFEPSSAVPCDLEKTSNTLSPPQLVESGSS